MITAAQLRAARGLLDWTRNDLAQAANVSPETIKNIEHGTFRPQETTADAIVKAFATHDVVFIENDGVQRHKDSVKTFSGVDGFKEMLAHVYQVVKNTTPMTRHLALSDTYGPDIAPEYIEEFSAKMAKVQGLDAKCLVWAEDFNFPFAYCQYRWLNRANVWVKPFYIYGNCVVFPMNTDPNSFMAVSIRSEHLASDMKEQFDALWSKAETPRKTTKSSKQ